MKSQTKNYFLVGFIFFLVLFFFFSDIVAHHQSVGGLSVEGRSEFPVAQEKKWKKPVPLVSSSPKASARAVLVKDPDSRTVLYEKNAEEKLPMASLTKLMTALVVTKFASPEELVVIEAQDTVTPPNKTDLVPGEKVLVKDLLNAMLVGSANDAALSLARHVAGSAETFVSYMNEEAKHLGMRDTFFKNPVGFDNAEQYSTAEDLSILVEEFLKHSELLEIVGQKDFKFYSLGGQKHYLTATNKLLENPRVLGIKTGYTSEAKGNIIILASYESEPQGLPVPRYYLIILGSSDREQEAETLINWIQQNFVWTP